MNPYARAAQFLVRLAGSGFVAISAILLLCNIAAVSVIEHPPEGPLAIGLEVLCLAAGCAILWKSKAIARRLAGDLWDDDQEPEEPEEPRE